MHNIKSVIMCFIRQHNLIVISSYFEFNKNHKLQITNKEKGSVLNKQSNCISYYCSRKNEHPGDLWVKYIDFYNLLHFFLCHFHKVHSKILKNNEGPLCNINLKNYIDDASAMKFSQ